METLEDQAIEALEHTTGQTAETIDVLLCVLGGNWREAIERVIWYFHALRSIEDYLTAYENYEI